MESLQKAKICRGQKLQGKKKKSENEFILIIDINAFGYLHNKSSLLLMQLTTKLNFKLC